MLSFVSWQSDSAAESDNEEEEVSLRLQAQFVTFTDFCVLSLQFIIGQEFRLLSLKHNAQLSFMRVSDNRSMGWAFKSFEENWGQNSSVFYRILAPLNSFTISSYSISEFSGLIS